MIITYIIRDRVNKVCATVVSPKDARLTLARGTFATEFRAFRTCTVKGTDE